MRRTAMVPSRNRSASACRRAAVRSTAPSPRMVASPRRRSSRKALRLPASTSRAALAACARQPISAMKTGISGAARSSARAATQEKGRIAAKIASGRTVAFSRAGWNRAR